jgi:uroporphyrin-III C-methyltransferase
MKKPRITLVGAGPGDAELITLKGLRALQEADVVLYDALANPSLLEYAKEGAEKIFVGKRAGLHYLQQAQINDLMVRMAKDHGHVVRLKGGDPFVFGRGQEEKAFAQAHGIPVEVVPGISSALAAPAANHIPLTSRGRSESFWVLTGTTKDEQLSADLALAAASSATIVILMGMHNLPQIVELFRQHRGDQEPVAIIMNGTRPDQQIGLGTLEDIESLAKEKQLGSPAVIVIGAVVQEHPDWLRQEVNYTLTAAGFAN